MTFRPGARMGLLLCCSGGAVLACGADTESKNAQTRQAGGQAANGILPASGGGSSVAADGPGGRAGTSVAAGSGAATARSAKGGAASGSASDGVAGDAGRPAGGLGATGGSSVTPGTARVGGRGPLGGSTAGEHDSSVTGGASPSETGIGGQDSSDENAETGRSATGGRRGLGEAAPAAAGAGDTAERERASSADAGADGTNAPKPTGQAGATALGEATHDQGVADAGATSIDAVPATDDAVVTFQNGVFWNDTEDERIEAHGGGFLQVGDTWYWIGEDKSHNSGNFQSVNCYASTDLVHWEFQNSAITRQTAPELSTSDRIIERPKLIYNKTTGKYVIWLHWEGRNYAEAAAGVFYSDTVCGDYTYHDSFRPNDNMSRDDTLFQDDDGTTYFISAANENKDLIVYQLTDDYLGIERQVVTLWPSGWREAPAMFKNEGTYFLITSDCTGWDPNQGQYATASSVAGPWSERKNLGNGTTFDTQPTYVIPVRGTEQTTYIYAGDRWQDPDLVSSKYIWLPLQLNGTTLRLDYYDRWQLNLTTGRWSAVDDYVPRTGWSLVHVDSE
ncbi:family 43 glycosylhydrolase, partial [Myxococcota bacterium]